VEKKSVICLVLFTRVNGQCGAAKLLMESGGAPMVNTRDPKGRWVCRSVTTTLSNGTVASHVSRFLIKRTTCCSACRSPLHAAAYSEKVEGLQLVLDQGAEVDAVDGSGRSALMVAADRGQTTAVGRHSGYRDAFPTGSSR